MQDILFAHYLTRFQVLVILLFAYCAWGVIHWCLRRRWLDNLKALEWKLAERQNEIDGLRDEVGSLKGRLEDRDPTRIRDLYDQLLSFIAHEFERPLHDIMAWSFKTWEGLEEKQGALRTQQNKIVSKASRMIQRALNIQELFAPESDDPPEKELLDMRLFVETMLIDDFGSLVESDGVTFLTTLADVELTFLNRHLTSVALGNVIHNAIKYSLRGGVVEIDLSLKAGVLKGAEKAICVDVKDTGRGIKEEDHDRIFELRVRGDGLIQPGQGLGLYLARKAARRQDGDVILVRSSLNQGSVFRVVLPYTGYRSA